MKHALRAAALVAVLYAPAFGQALETEQSADATVEASPAIWRVADDDTELFLLGTFHILPPDVNWRTDAVETALEKSDIIYFEVDADAPDAQTKTVGVMMTEGFNPNGAKLTELLEADDAKALRSITTGLGLPLSAIDPMRPWQAFLTLTVQFIVSQGFDPSAGVDSVLLREARTLKKDIRFFETIEEQLALFTDLAPDVERDLLVFTLRDWENQTAAFDDLFIAWASGDDGAIDGQMNDSMRDAAPEVFEALLTRRNENWAETLDDVLRAEEGAVLVAVGAAHLVGDGSVPALLSERGYEVGRFGVDEENVDEENNAVADDEIDDAPAAANDNDRAETDEADEDELGELLKDIVD